MNMLYSPWREDYTNSVSGTAEKLDPAQTESCVFCSIAENKDKDSQNFVLQRFTTCYIILNRYPYNAGHILIIPYLHHKDLPIYSDATRLELMTLINSTTAVLQKALACDGINIGINMGKAAGAGIPAHLHAHVLPRWNGDTNFLPTLANTKTISFDLPTLYEKLLPYFV